MPRKRPFLIGNKEIAELHRVTVRTAWSKGQKIRMMFNKKPHQPITVFEYAQYMGIPVEDVYRALE